MRKTYNVPGKKGDEHKNEKTHTRKKKIIKIKANMKIASKINHTLKQ